MEKSDIAYTTIELGELDNTKIIPTYVNSLSSREMETLIAFCDTLWPSIPVFDNKKLTGHDSGLISYYTKSASMAGTPQLVAGFMSERLKHPMKPVLRLALWVLSTWIGTLVMCGRLSLSSQFPYVLSFSQISQKKREQILLSWSSSYFYLLRMLFYVLKFLVLLIFFTQVDENNKNPSWKALGYCGPDPDFLSQAEKSKSSKREVNSLIDKIEDGAYGPLYRGLIDLKCPKQDIVEILKQSGLSVSTHQTNKSKPSSICSPSLTIHCDAVVVGSGSGGGVAAGILAKAGYKVLVLEKGNYQARTTLSLLEGQTMDQMYQGGGIVGTKDLSAVILAGSTVGGGSTINWSASIKTPQHVLNEWCDRYQLELFKSELYKEALHVVCDRMGVQPDFHEEGLNNAVLRKGCSELGYPVENIPRNSSPDHYCGWCGLGCKDGRKRGVSETWLVDVVDSGNGVILPGCEALKVLHERKRATGVAFKFDKEIYLVKSKVVVVACGALGTPALLKQSEMRNINIGKHLHLHPVIMAWGYFPNEAGKSYEGGIMTSMSGIVAEFNGSGYGALIQTPSLHPGMFSALMPWVSGIDMKERMTKFSKTAHVFALARDVGEGEVNSISSISYKVDKRDEKTIKKGVEKVLRILAAAGAEEIGTHHRNGKKLNVKKASWVELDKFIKEESSREVKELGMPVCSAHQMGSCRMGVDPKRSVVKENGETWEVEGLFVADSSVFPTALGVNPMVTIQAIAYCTARSVVEVLRRKEKSL